MKALLLASTVLSFTVFQSVSGYREWHTGDSEDIKKSLCRLHGLTRWKFMAYRKKLEDLQARVKRIEHQVDCPKNYRWYDQGKFCYRHFVYCETWDGARRVCKMSKADLITVQDDDTFSFVRRVANETKDRWLCPLGVWLGASDREKEGEWKWISGEELNISDHKWTPGGPDNYKGSQNCLILQKQAGFMFDDAWCKAKRQYMCQYTP